MSSHVCSQHISTEHLLCARTCAGSRGSQLGGYRVPSLMPRFLLLLPSCYLKQDSKFCLQAWGGCPLTRHTHSKKIRQCLPVAHLKQLQSFTYSCLSACPCEVNGLLHIEGFCLNSPFTLFLSSPWLFIIETHTLILTDQAERKGPGLYV